MQLCGEKRELRSKGATQVILLVLANMFRTKRF